MRRLALIVLALSLLSCPSPSPTVHAQQGPAQFKLELEGTWFGVERAEVLGTCDGPHRVYVARSGKGAGASVAIAVVPGGCIQGLKPAELP